MIITSLATFVIVLRRSTKKSIAWSLSAQGRKEKRRNLHIGNGLRDIVGREDSLPDGDQSDHPSARDRSRPDRAETAAEGDVDPSEGRHGVQDIDGARQE
jgi:hypothetical protein